jgi:cation transport regulator ChaB
MFQKEFIFNFDVKNNLDFTDKATKRVFKTNLFEFNRSKVKQKLITLIEAYDYKNAYQFCLENRIVNSDVIKLILEAVNLEDMTSNKKYFSMCEIGSYPYFIMNYYVQWELEYLRKKYINYILKSTPLLYALMRTKFIEHLDKIKYKELISVLENENKILKEPAIELKSSLSSFFKSNRDRENGNTNILLSLYDGITNKDNEYYLLKDLRNIESETRNHIAHEVNNASIKKEKYKNDADRLHEKMHRTISLVLRKYYVEEEALIFHNKNLEILEEIKKI